MAGRAAWSAAAEAGVAGVAEAVAGDLARRIEQCGEPDVTSIHTFDSAKPPPLGISPYLARFAAYASPGVEGMVLALLLINRLLEKRNGMLRITPLNVHRIVAAAVLVAGKLALERYFRNTRVASVAGLPVSELNELERALLAALAYDIGFNEAELDEVVSKLFPV